MTTVTLQALQKLR